jgi:hypothetical protein
MATFVIADNPRRVLRTEFAPIIEWIPKAPPNAITQILAAFRITDD